MSQYMKVSTVALVLMEGFGEGHVTPVSNLNGEWIVAVSDEAAEALEKFIPIDGTWTDAVLRAFLATAEFRVCH